MKRDGRAGSAAAAAAAAGAVLPSSEVLPSSAGASSAGGALVVVVRLRPRKLSAGRLRIVLRAVVLGVASAALPASALSSSPVDLSVVVVLLPRRLNRLRATMGETQFRYLFIHGHKGSLRLPRAKPELTGFTSLAGAISSSTAGSTAGSGLAVVRAPGRARPPIEGREKRSVERKAERERGERRAKTMD